MAPVSLTLDIQQRAKASAAGRFIGTAVGDAPPYPLREITGADALEIIGITGGGLPGIVTPEAHGAVGNGSTSDTTALNAAIAEAVSTGARLVGDPGKIYYVGTSLNDFTGTLRISDLHFRAPNGVRILRGNPTWAAENATVTALSTTVLGGANVTRVALASTAGLAVGDWVMVGSSTVRWVGNNQIFWFETAQIVALAASTTIDLHRRLLGEETGLLNGSLRLFKIPNYRLEAQRIRFSVNGDPFATGQTNRQIALELRGGVGHQLDDISADTWWGRIVVTRCAVLSSISGLYWNQLPDITSPTTEALGYGYQDECAGYGNSVFGMVGGRCRHAFTNSSFNTATYSASTPWQYGMPTNSYCANSTVSGHSNAYDTHVESIGATFSNCLALDPVTQPDSNAGDPTGFQDRGFRTRYVSCSARAGDFGFRSAIADQDWTALGGNVATYETCAANDTDQAGMFFDGVAAGSEILVNGFTVHGAGYAFQSGASSPFAGRLKAEAVLTTGLSGGLYLDGGHTGTVDIALGTALGDSAPNTQIIVNGAITPTTSFTFVDTEGSSATDELTHIALTHFHPGALMLLRSVASARKITLMDAVGGTGQLQLAGGENWLLESSSQVILLRATSTDWVEVTRGWGVADAAFREYIDISALNTPYDNTQSGSTAESVQAALDEIFAGGVGGGGDSFTTLDDGSTAITIGAAPNTHRRLTSGSAITLTLSATAAVGVKQSFVKKGAGAITVQVTGSSTYRLPGDTADRTTSFTLAGYCHFECVANAGSAAKWDVTGDTSHPETMDSELVVQGIVVTHVANSGALTVTRALHSGRTIVQTGAAATFTFTGSNLGAGCQGVIHNAGSGAITISTNRTLKGVSTIPIDASATWEDDGTRLWVRAS
jgi:hypothetical protein